MTIEESIKELSMRSAVVCEALLTRVNLVAGWTLEFHAVAMVRIHVVPQPTSGLVHFTASLYSTSEGAVRRRNDTIRVGRCNVVFRGCCSRLLLGSFLLVCRFRCSRRKGSNSASAASTTSPSSTQRYCSATQRNSQSTCFPAVRFYCSFNRCRNCCWNRVVVLHARLSIHQRSSLHVQHCPIGHIQQRTSLCKLQ